MGSSSRAIDYSETSIETMEDFVVDEDEIEDDDDEDDENDGGDDEG